MNRPVELYNLLLILRPDIMHSRFHEYASRYCDPHLGSYGYNYSGHSCLRELHHVISHSVMIRRLKSEVMDQLPPKIRSRVYVPLEEKVAKKVRKVLTNVIDDCGEEAPMDKIGRMLGARELPECREEEEDGSLWHAYLQTGQAKLDGICEFLDMMLDND